MCPTMLVVRLSLLITRRRAASAHWSMGWAQDLRAIRRRGNASFTQLKKSPSRLPSDSFCTRCFLNHWYYSHSWKDRQITGLALRVTRVKGASTRPQSTSPSTYYTRGEWSVHVMADSPGGKNQEVHPSFWLVTDHLYPPKAGAGLQTAFLWDSAVKWDLQYFCVSECWVGIFLKKRIILHLIQEKQVFQWSLPRNTLGERFPEVCVCIGRGGNFTGEAFPASRYY